MDAHPGATLAEARGHGSTPEHPSDDYAREDPRYEEYFDRRDSMEDHANSLKEDAYGDLDTFNKDGAEESTGKISMHDLEIAMQFDTIEELREAYPELADEFGHYH